MGPTISEFGERDEIPEDMSLDQLIDFAEKTDKKTDPHVNKAYYILSRLKRLSSTEDFRMEDQAILLGKNLFVFKNVFRLDSRTPGEVANQGFIPNPQKPKGSIAEHVEPFSAGTSNYVSLTTKAANRHLLLRSSAFTYRLPYF